MILSVLHPILPGLSKTLPTSGDLAGFAFFVLMVGIGTVVYKKIKGIPVWW